MNTSTQAAVPVVGLHGVHHAARPTWKLAETVRFYRDLLGLPLVHAISAKGWGPDNHADFLHFFFDSGNGSTIAFFYYIGTERPEWLTVREHYQDRANTRHGAFATSRAAAMAPARRGGWHSAALSDPP
ncbi:VOC family protein [Cupriavidus basilensis]